MDFSQPFSTLNERLRPRFTTSEKLYSSLSRLEDRQPASVRYLPTYYRPTVLPAQPEPIFPVPTTEPEEPEEPKEDAEQGDLISNDSSLSELSLKDVPTTEPEEPKEPKEDAEQGDLISNDSSLSELSLKDVDGEELGEDEESSTSVSEEKDIEGELTSKETGDSSQTAASEGESSLQRRFMDGTLPDLVRSGRPLGRRRTLGHVSDTLQEVRREVALSRKRSIKLKAQVDKLSESSDGLGWSQHRETVTEEVQSILRLLLPLTKPESGPPQPSPGKNQLDFALAQLQNVARKLAISHTTQFRSGNSAEDSAILQQALCDRDEAIEKKKAMEAELLRSKTEMMLLNNQLLEAVQKRLELSLELEAWKEDVQFIIQQQVQIQQQAEQAQKKSSRMGILRRHNKPPLQRPPTMPTPATPVTNASQIFITKSASSTASTPITPSSTGTQRNWRDKLKRGKTSHSGDQDAGEQVSERGNHDDGFQVVSLD